MDAGSIRAGRAYVEIGADNSKLLRTLYNSAREVEKYGAAIRGIGMQLATAGAGILTPLAASAQHFASHGQAIEQHSQKTGLSTDATQSLGYAAQQTGTDVDSLVTGVSKMSRSLVDAANGGKEAHAALQQVGTSVGQLNKMTQEDRFKTIAEGISKIPDPAARAAAAMKIFGKGGAELLPLLNQGSDGISKIQARFEALGLGMSKQDVDAATKFSRTLDDLWDVLGRVSDIIGSAVVPVFTKLANMVINAAVAAGKWVQDHRELFELAVKIGAGLLVAGVAFVALGTAITAVGIVLGSVASILGIVFTAIGALLSPIVLVGGGLAALAAYFLYTSGKAGDACNWIIDAFKSVYNAIKFVFDNTGSLSAAWSAGITLGAKMLKLAWVTAAGFVEELWVGLKGSAINVWHEIGTGISEATSLAVKDFSTMWVEAMHAWETLVNRTARAVQQLFFETSQSQLKAELDRIQGLQNSGKLSSEQADKARSTAHATFDTYDDKQYAQADKQNDDDLASKLKTIQDEANARISADEAVLRNKKINNAAEIAAIKARVAIEKEVAQDAIDQYKNSLLVKHDKSGETSLSDQVKNIVDKITSLQVPDFTLKNQNNSSGILGNAVSNPLGGFNLNSQALINESFGSGGDVPKQQLTVLKRIAGGINTIKSKVGPMRAT